MFTKLTILKNITIFLKNKLNLILIFNNLIMFPQLFCLFLFSFSLTSSLVFVLNFQNIIAIVPEKSYYYKNKGSDDQNNHKVMLDPLQLLPIHWCNFIGRMVIVGILYGKWKYLVYIELHFSCFFNCIRKNYCIGWQYHFSSYQIKNK